MSKVSFTSVNKLIHLDPIPDFEDKSEIKPWLQKIFYPQGIELVIERSDKVKVVFKCKAPRKKRNILNHIHIHNNNTEHRHSHDDPDNNNNTHQHNNSPNLLDSPIDLTAFENLDQDILDSSNTINPVNDSNISKDKKKRVVSKYNTCPFRIRATFSIKRKKWNIVILNNNHSHELKFNPTSEDYKKFKDYLRKKNDVDAIKTFDELEYRFKSNLPLIPSIPCDCGLTNEIECFNIHIPAQKRQQVKIKNTPRSNNNSNSNPNSSINSPIGNNNKINKNKKILNTTNLNAIQKSTFLSSLDDTTQETTNIFTASSTNDLNEIDFTNVFKKISYKKQNKQQQQQQELQHQQQHNRPSSSNVFNSNTDLQNLINPHELIFNSPPSPSQYTNMDRGNSLPRDFLASDDLNIINNNNILMHDFNQIASDMNFNVNESHIVHSPVIKKENEDNILNQQLPQTDNINELLTTNQEPQIFFKEDNGNNQANNNNNSFSLIEELEKINNDFNDVNTNNNNNSIKEHSHIFHSNFKEEDILHNLIRKESLPQIDFHNNNSNNELNNNINTSHFDPMTLDDISLDNFEFFN